MLPIVIALTAAIGTGSAAYAHETDTNFTNYYKSANNFVEQQLVSDYADQLYIPPGAGIMLKQMGKMIHELQDLKSEIDQHHSNVKTKEMMKNAQQMAEHANKYDKVMQSNSNFQNEYQKRIEMMKQYQKKMHGYDEMMRKEMHKEKKMLRPYVRQDYEDTINVLEQKLDNVWDLVDIIRDQNYELRKTIDDLRRNNDELRALMDEPYPAKPTCNQKHHNCWNPKPKPWYNGTPNWMQPMDSKPMKKYEGPGAWIDPYTDPYGEFIHEDEGEQGAWDHDMNGEGPETGRGSPRDTMNVPGTVAPPTDDLAPNPPKY